MSNADRFARRMIQIAGVSQFVLCRHDGNVITHNMQECDDLASVATICGMSAQAIQSIIGFSGFRHLSFSLQGRQNCHIFPIDKYFLGVIQTAESSSGQVLTDVQNFLQSLVRQK